MDSGSSDTHARIEPRKTPQQARAKARFERILEVALAQLIGKGSDAVRMNEIAKAAEISIASLYQYFPDKAAIIATLADRSNEIVQECVREIFAPVATADQLIDAACAMLESYFDYFHSDPAALAIWQATQSEPRLQALDREDMERHGETILQGLIRARRDMQIAEARQVACLLMHIIASSVRAAVILPDDEARAMIDSAKALIITPFMQKALAPDA